MRESGMPVTRIAEHLGVHRSTVHRWLAARGNPKSRRPSKLDPYREYIRSRLRRFRLPATVMIDEIIAQGYTVALPSSRSTCVR